MKLILHIGSSTYRLLVGPNFTDSSTERVYGNSNFWDTAISLTYTIHFKVGQCEEIVDIVLFTVYKAPIKNY